MTSIKEFVLDTYSRTWDNKNLRFLLGNFTINEIAAQIIDWLKSDEENYYDITLFARDLYIGSDLTENERHRYYNELVRQGFFEILNERLYSDSLGNKSWTVYTIGKFGHPENAVLLEAAYEKEFSITNPILAIKCLFELSFLESKKITRYINTLKDETSISSKIILLCYYFHGPYEKEFKNILKNNKEVVKFILPSSDKIDLDEIETRLVNFEIFFDRLEYNLENQFRSMDIFMKIAAKYFKDFDFFNEQPISYEDFITKINFTEKNEQS